MDPDQEPSDWVHSLPLLALVIYAAGDINRCHFYVEILPVN